MTRSEIFAVVRSKILEIVEEARDREITEEMSMTDLGADSLQIVEVVSRSMKALRLKVARTDLMAARNLADLVDVFEKAAGEPPSAS
jgi:acyl carrier protein